MSRDFSHRARGVAMPHKKQHGWYVLCSAASFMFCSCASFLSMFFMLMLQRLQANQHAADLLRYLPCPLTAQHCQTDPRPEQSCKPREGTSVAQQSQEAK